MTPIDTFILVAIIPVILLMWLRVNAAIVFLSLCLGDVLVQFVAPDANQFLALFSAHVPHGLDNGNDLIKILLLTLPVILTAIFMIRTIHGYPKLILNLLPALGVGLLGSLLITPLLPKGVSHSILTSSLWSHIKNAQALIVSGSAIICLLILWLQRPKTGHKKDKHK
ncbi:MAG TPA: hypothetical protein VLF63_02330 [Patescibacteria group bacterium]|nr:hypothetical protein [Patescibacteria group bacterium]